MKRTTSSEIAPAGRGTPPPDLQEADHRIANSLQLVAVMLRTEMRGADLDGTARSILTATAARLDSVGRVHRMLAARAGGNALQLDTFLRDLGAELSAGIGVTMHFDLEPATMKASAAAQVGTILTELTINSAKHGASDDGRAEVTIAGTCEGDGRYVLTVRDGGRGMHGQEAGGAGMGRRIITRALERLGGESRPLPGPGAGTELRFPVMRTASPRN